jgi:RNA polymerase sigma-70 factor (ECF subfamily)
MTDEAEHPTDRIRHALERYEGRLTRYATRITGDLDQARDIVQETFLRLCRTDPSRVDGRLGEWLFTVCRNRAIDVGRKESRMKPLSEGLAEARETLEPAPADVAEARESKGRLRRVLDTLPERQQEVIRLKFQEGMSYREISRVTKLTVSNVGYLLHTGIQTMRSQLGAGPGVAREA